MTNKDLLKIADQFGLLQLMFMMQKALKFNTKNLLLLSIKAHDFFMRVKHFQHQHLKICKKFGRKSRFCFHQRGEIGFKGGFLNRVKFFSRQTVWIWRKSRKQCRWKFTSISTTFPFLNNLETNMAIHTLFLWESIRTFSQVETTKYQQVTSFQSLEFLFTNSVILNELWKPRELM